MRHYCTFFDHRFLLHGLTLYESLRRHAGEFVLHALCFDTAAYQALRALGLPNFRPITLVELEKADPQLAAAKSKRTKIEYYFTCTPTLLLQLMEQHPEAETVSYLDADLFFYADPAPVFEELSAGSALIIPHRLPNAFKHFEVYGLYNAGVFFFRNDAPARAILHWWRQRCLEWCHERLEDGRYCNQKYLDRWPELFPSTVVCRHLGVNLAPWNLANHPITWREGKVCVGDDPLIFYHFHRLRIVRPYLFDPGLEHYGAGLTPVIARHIYEPYLRQLRRTMPLALKLLRSSAAQAHENLRLTMPATSRDLVRLLLYNQTFLCLGPLAMPLRLEPLAWPLLRLRELAKRAA